MTEKLPEELLQEILKWAFYSRVDDTFLVSCRRHRQIIGHHSLCKPMPTQLLLVCKKWHRVGTPSLYAIIKLHDNVNMQLLAKTLQSVPSRGPMIRHLRLNGCYERSLHTIAKLTPNVRVLSLQLHILSHEKKVGLLKALPLWDITDLFLHYTTSRANRQSTEVSQAVVRAMKDWTHKSLNRVVMAGMPWMFSDWFNTPDVAEVFVSATRPYEIASDRYILESLMESGLLCRIAEGKITRITCYDASGLFDDDDSFDTSSDFRTPEHVKKLIVYKDSALQYSIRKVIADIDAAMEDEKAI